MSDQRNITPVAPVRPKKAPGTTTGSSPSHSFPMDPRTSGTPSHLSRNPEGHPPSTKTYVPQRQGSSDSTSSASTANFSTVSAASVSDKTTVTAGHHRGAPSVKSSSSSSLSANGEPGAISSKEARISNHSRGEDAFGILTGEEVKLTSKTVQFSCPYTDTMKSGTLSVTNYRLVFRSSSSADYTSSFEIPLSSILSIEKVSGPTVNRNSENSFRLRIWCKDLRKIVLVITKNAEEPSQKNFMEVLRQFAFPVSNKRQLFAFDYKGDYVVDGWSIYDARAEYRRQGVPNEMWRLTNVNNKYELSDTYPALLAVPGTASDDTLMGVAGFRSRGRIPVLSWIHPISHATITRSSQPLVGLQGRRSKDDEGYLKLIHEANPMCPRLCIMDARPLVNAQANRAKGGGYESEENYASIEIIFLDIHNIHVMRESLRKIREMCSPKIEDPNHFYSNLEASHWLHHIKAILAGALKIVDKVETYKSSVLVHCSDGWDRTAQLTTLSMIMLDPYYRTIRGFEVLIEKEWISFGHKFAHRIGHGEEKQDSDRSPVFLQFIDCVWQLTQQFETAFEFNERFLISILDHLYSCRYGTFLCNFEKEVHEKNVRGKTISLWSFINSNPNDFRNPFYYQPPVDAADQVDNVLYPLTTLRYVQLWMRYYARWDPSTKQQEPIDERYKQLLFAVQRLTDIRDNLKREVATRGPSHPSSGASGSPSHHSAGPVHV